MEKEENITTDQNWSENTGPRRKEQAREKVPSLKEEVLDRGKRYLEMSKASSVEFIRDIAKAMETAATQLEDRDRKTTGGYIRSASREIQQWSSILSQYEVDSVVRQLQSFANRHPGIVVGGAAAAGFAVTRLLRSAEKPPEPAGGEEPLRPESAETEPEYGTAPEGYRQAPSEESVQEYGPHS